ncbi:hypothetical protein DV738_g5150, partial [Chaetothyriales sp. CBS 135597]
MANDESDALDVLEKEAKEYDKDAEIDRILKAFRLDAYAVLDLQPGVPDSDIKNVYRKKSLLIHPDKTKNPQAPEAFDRLKKAQSALLDEGQRKHLDECISDARLLLMRQYKYTVDSEELKTDEFKQEWRRKTIEVLVDAEARRRRQIKAKMQEEGREKAKEEAEIEERKRKRDHEKKWEETREQRIDNWRQFQKGSKKAEEGKKKKKLKELIALELGQHSPAKAHYGLLGAASAAATQPSALRLRSMATMAEEPPPMTLQQRIAALNAAHLPTSRSASNDRIKAPAWGECELPALPPPRNASQPRKPSFERSKYVNRAPSYDTIVAVAPAATPAATAAATPSRPPLPPRLPPRKVVLNPVSSPEPQNNIKTSALSYALNKPQTAPETSRPVPSVQVTVAQTKTALHGLASLSLQRVQSEPSTTSNPIGRRSPPIPSKPDISAIQATKPKLVPKPTILNSPSQSGAAVCLVCRDFSLPDAHAAKFPRHTVSNLQDLAYHLTAPFPSATDKARVICTWLHLNVAYDVDNFFRGTVKSSTPESTLQTGLAVCEGYAHLFTRLATYGGLESVVVGGHGKGFGYAPLVAGSGPVPFNGNHAWNAVKIDGGEWKLIDSCWYSGHVQERGMPFVAKRNDSMFTMTNEEFGIKHFPENREHFFLPAARPVMTWEEYIQINPDHWPHNVQPPTIYSPAEEEYFIGKQTVAPHSRQISVRQGASVRFQFGLRCPHWNLAQHTTLGPPPVFLMQIEGRDGRSRDFIPFEHIPATAGSSSGSGDLWYVDIPAIDLGAPGQTISCYAVTSVGDCTHCRGLSVAEFKEMKGKVAIGFAGVMAWELVA